MSADDKIYVRFRGRTLGPLTPQKVRELIQRGQITRMHELSSNGLSWTKAEEFGDFFAAPRQVAQSTDQVETDATTKGSVENDSAQTTASTVNPYAAVEPTVEWYAHVNGDNQGPVSLEKLKEWFDSGVVTETTLIWRSGLDSWKPAAEAIPEQFRPRHRSPMPSAAGQSGQYTLGVGDGAHEAADVTTLARELNRQRGWAFFFALVLVVVSSLTILGDLMIVLTAATGSAAGANTAVPMVFAILGIAFAGTVMTAGVLLLQYCGRISRVSVHPSKNSIVSAVKSLNSLWTFVGLASLIWLVTSITIFIVLFSMGLVAIDQAT